MAEKIRIVLDENHEITSAEVNIDGKWQEADYTKASGGGEATASGACGEGVPGCPAKPNLCAYNIMGNCLYLPC